MRIRETTGERPLPRRVPVLVAGGGPVGLVTAMFLARWGVPALVVDKRDPLTGPPRAMSSIRTLELLRSAGLGDAVERTGWYGAEPFQAVFKDSALGTVRQRGGWEHRTAVRELVPCGRENCEDPGGTHRPAPHPIG